MDADLDLAGLAFVLAQADGANSATLRRCPPGLQGQGLQQEPTPLSQVTHFPNLMASLGGK